MSGEINYYLSLSMVTKLTRRDFLKSSMAAGVALALPVR